MPKGQTIISWTADNEAKLLLAILTVHDIKVNHAAVAAIFGPDVPGSCIQTKMSAIRKKAAKMGLTATLTPVTTNRRAAPSTTKGQTKKAQIGNPIKKEQNGDREENTEPFIATDDEVNGPLNDQETKYSTPPETFYSQDTITTKTDHKTPTPASKITSSSVTNKVIGGRVTKKRASPRKTTKPDYHHLDDPFATMDADTDGEGGKVFGEVASSSEDSAAEDGAFEAGEVEDDVPMEV